MQIHPYRNRLRPLLRSAIKLGAAYGFFASLISTFLVFLLFFLSAVSAPPSPHHDSAIMGSFFIGMMIGMGTVIPSTIIGIVGGILIAAILAMWEKRVVSILASSIGLIVGIIIMLIVNYILWQNKFAGVPAETPFLDFLINQNLFSVPSLIAIFLSTIGAWQINRKEPLELSTG